MDKLITFEFFNGCLDKSDIKPFNVCLTICNELDLPLKISSDSMKVKVFLPLLSWLLPLPVVILLELIIPLCYRLILLASCLEWSRLILIILISRSLVEASALLSLIVGFFWLPFLFRL